MLSKDAVLLLLRNEKSILAASKEIGVNHNTITAFMRRGNCELKTFEILSDYYTRSDALNKMIEDKKQTLKTLEKEASK